MATKRTPRKRRARNPLAGKRYSNVMFKLSDEDRAYIQNRPIQALDEIILGKANLASLKVARVRTEYVQQMARYFNEAPTILDMVERANDVLIASFLDYSIKKTFDFCMERYMTVLDALLLANQIDSKSVRREQYHAYLEAVRIIDKDPLFSSI